MNIYTKTGDKGLSGLIGGTRVSKDDIRLEAYGSIDELNSFLGLLLAEGLDAADEAFNQNIQHRLFKIGSNLATDQEKTKLNFKDPITDENLIEMEAEIDRIVTGLPELNRFIIPGGNRKAGLSHVCRTVCRRAERCTVAVAEKYQVHPNIITYLNRLSDYFFVLARKCCLSDSSEFFWDNTK
ncbi:MAG TPA: cob(I)yrinic acid a,c-diamide adenosyltransferase [Bacteroidales bacterium]|nr:cob(I)yrinic acid a,c-diamide adenosyltransferase [Bacteroidales bacterium]